jgi:hypothetical protein
LLVVGRKDKVFGVILIHFLNNAPVGNYQGMVVGYPLSHPDGTWFPALGIPTRSYAENIYDPDLFGISYNQGF